MKRTVPIGCVALAIAGAAFAAERGRFSLPPLSQPKTPVATISQTTGAGGSDIPTSIAGALDWSATSGQDVALSLISRNDVISGKVLAVDDERDTVALQGPTSAYLVRLSQISFIQIGAAAPIASQPTPAAATTLQPAAAATVEEPTEEPVAEEEKPAEEPPVRKKVRKSKNVAPAGSIPEPPAPKPEAKFTD